MKKKKTIIEYPWINKLRLEIKFEGEISYITSKQLKQVLTKEQMERFAVYYGCQTAILTKGGELGMYLSDIESVLERIFRGRLTGTQNPVLWD